MAEIEWRTNALAEISTHPAMSDFLQSVAVKVRDQARANVQSHYPGTRRDKAIAAVPGADAQSAYADVGYLRKHTGFVLWWSEVGTQQMSPRPHLRAALNQIHL